MRWKRERVYKGKYKNYSISSKLRKEGKSNDEFETMLSNLALEDIVALKLEISARPISNRVYGVPIWTALPDMIKEAVFKFAYSASRTQGEAMNFLGLPEIRFYEFKNRFGIERFFEK
jgi:hypothetical protein